MYKHTSTGKNPAIQLGQHVAFNTLLKRHDQNHKWPKTRRTWLEINLRENQRGIVIGTRTYSNGDIEYPHGDSDAVTDYKADEFFEVALVVAHLRRAPVAVRLDKVWPLEA